MSESQRPSPQDLYEDLAIDPEEATNMPLHVKNCGRRHTAVVRIIRGVETKLDTLCRKDRWYQMGMLGGMLMILAKEFGLPVEVIGAIAKVIFP